MPQFLSSINSNSTISKAAGVIHWRIPRHSEPLNKQTVKAAMQLNASELFKKIVEEDPLFKLEVKGKFQEAEELKKWILVIMKEVNIVAEKMNGRQHFSTHINC